MLPSIYLNNKNKHKTVIRPVIRPDETGYRIVLEKTSLQLMFSLKMSIEIDISMMGENAIVFNRINSCHGNSIFKILELFPLIYDSVGQRKSYF